jgi:hypothetical protein
MIKLGERSKEQTQSDYMLAHKALMEMGAGIANFYMEVAKGNVDGHRLMYSHIQTSPLVISETEGPEQIAQSESVYMVPEEVDCFILDIRISSPLDKFQAFLKYQEPGKYIKKIHSFYKPVDLTIPVALGPFPAGTKIFLESLDKLDFFSQYMLIDRD